MDTLVGQRLGDFEVVRIVGRGGMGVVFEARQVSLNRRVALKVLGQGLGLTPKAVHRFRREAEAAAKLHHTNIVPIYATGEDRGVHFYAMELIEGPSLDAVIGQLREQGGGPAKATPTIVPELTATGPYLDTTTLTGSGVSSGLSSGSGYFDTVARMIADVADALHHAHQNNVIHRDIKPSNLLLSPDGRLSVNDFGLARVLEEPGMTTTGEFVGTPAYMAPEQIAGGRIPVDHRCDVYSLGATLYELLTLRPPFVAERRDQLLAMVVQKEPSSPHSVNPKVPRDLETICLKCLEKDPDRRYANAKELADDLRRYVNRFAIAARRTGPVAKAVKWVKRNPALSAAVAMAILCAGVAGGLGYRALQAQREHDAKLLDEKRRAALEKAILSAKVEDFDGARQAIREAEELGCSDGQLHMLRGQLELCQGHAPEAIEHLRRAVGLLPESVAARSMLSAAMSDAGQMTEAYVELGEALRLPAVTPEDYMFRGHANANLDPDSGLSDLDEAVRLRPTELARLLRLDALRIYVLDRRDLEKAKILMEDVRLIKRHLPENPMVLILSVTVHTTCYHVFGALGQSDFRKVALDEGGNDARALLRFPQSLNAVKRRWEFLEETGQESAGLAELRRSWEETKELYLGGYLATFLYRRGDFEAFCQVLGRYKGVNTVFDLYFLVGLAELGPDGWSQAEKFYREITTRKLGSWDLFNSQLILRFLGHADEAGFVCREFLKRPDQFPPVRQESFRQFLRYCADELPEDQLLISVQGSQADRANAHLSIALTALARGNRPKAKEHLCRCVETRHVEIFPYHLAKLLLSRMEKDSAWPPWIARKK